MNSRTPRLACLAAIASVWACSSSETSFEGRPTGPAYSQSAGAGGGGLGTGAGAIGGAGAPGGGTTGTTIPPGFQCDISGCEAAAGSAGVQAGGSGGASAGSPAAGNAGNGGQPATGGGGQGAGGSAPLAGNGGATQAGAGGAGKGGAGGAGAQQGGGSGVGGAGGAVVAGAGGSLGGAGNSVGGAAGSGSFGATGGAAGGPVAGSGGAGAGGAAGATAGAGGATGGQGGGSAGYPAPTAYWPLDTVGGTALAESSTIYGAMVGDVSAVPGLEGNAMRIGAKDSYLWVPPTAWTQTLSEVGVSLWVRPEEDWDQLHGHRLFGRDNLLLSRYASDLTFAVGQVTVTVTTTMLKDHWYHVVASYSAGADITLSVQDLVTTVPVTGSMFAGTSGVVVGATGPLNVFLVDSGSFHAGAVDDVAVFDRALSPDDAANLFVLGSTGASPVCPGCSTPLAPLHAWRFDESTYDRATQELVTALPSATVGYTDLASGIVGGALHVSGIVASGFTYQPGAGVHVGSLPQLHPTAFTLSAWVKPDRQLGPGDTQMAWFASAQVLPNRGFWFGYDQGLTFTLGDGLTGNVPRQLQPLPMMGGVWYHVAATWDGTKMTMYLDGSVAGSVQPGITYSPGDAPLLLCGTNESVIGRPVFPGACDEMAIFSQALSATEVTALYVRGASALPLF